MLHLLAETTVAAGPSAFAVTSWIVGAVVSLIGLVMGILGYSKANQRAEKADLVELERRLVTLETSVRTNANPSILDRITALEQKTSSNPNLSDRITALEQRTALLHNYDASLIQERIAKIETKID